MLCIKSLIKNPAKYKAILAKRGYILDIDKLINLFNNARGLNHDICNCNRIINEISEKIKSTGKQCSEFKSYVEQSNLLSEKIKAYKLKYKKAQEEINAFLDPIPNIVNVLTPAKPKILMEYLVDEKRCNTGFSHIQIPGIQRDIASIVSGVKFSYLVGNVATIHRAIGQFMIDLHIKNHGYQEIYTPLIVKAESMRRTGQLSSLSHALYRCDEGYLIPTSEVSLLNRHYNSILNASSLPIKEIAITSCFRKEVGKYGFEERGLIRQHQFEKVELINIYDPLNLDQHKIGICRMCVEASNVLKLLEIPHRIVALDASDLPFSSAQTYDIEAWSPGQNKFIEVSSASDCLDFQCRRLKIRIRRRSKDKVIAHSSNASGLAVGRTLIAVLENHCDNTGIFHVPDPLVKYLHKKQVKVF